MEVCRPRSPTRCQGSRAPRAPQCLPRPHPQEPPGPGPLASSVHVLRRKPTLPPQWNRQCEDLEPPEDPRAPDAPSFELGETCPLPPSIKVQLAQDSRRGGPTPTGNLGSVLGLCACPPLLPAGACAPTHTLPRNGGLSQVTLRVGSRRRPEPGPFCTLPSMAHRPRFCSHHPKPLGPPGMLPAAGRAGRQVPPAIPGRPSALCSWQDIVALESMPARVEFHGPTEFLGSLAFSLVPRLLRA